MNFAPSCRLASAVTHSPLIASNLNRPAAAESGGSSSLWPHGGQGRFNFETSTSRIVEIDMAASLGSVELPDRLRAYLKGLRRLTGLSVITLPLFLFRSKLPVSCISFDFPFSLPLSCSCCGPSGFSCSQFCACNGMHTQRHRFLNKKKMKTLHWLCFLHKVLQAEKLSKSKMLLRINSF